ncbi:restriction endonuclease subunit S [Virgibacillus sp. C22-A2]|uniref:Restriction endonuclease subunit S n=1 Tax=Virgibacillus tibetensis TaxID=3042313 RepID=A0ABU6KG55_9BACI|nr:restriction endonuclease subunit S [Virgibacillus sp. C22-A2]
MEELKRYPEYKESGIEWIGEIPRGWTSGGVTKYLSSLVDYRGKTPEKVDEGVFLVTAKNIKNGQIDYSVSQEYVRKEEYQEIMRRGIPLIGDVLFTTEAPLGEVANVNKTHIALAQRVIKFRAKEDVLYNYYLKYWMMSHGFQSNLQTFATGSTAAGIKASKLSKLVVLLPPYDEQKKITNFLDEKTFEIESLISEKEKLIELFEEKRQAIITEAVTKGLNTDVKMKDSGVEWIGEIPEHWEVGKLKYLSNEKMQYGANESAELDDENLPRYIRITDIDKRGILKDETFKSLPWEKARNYILSKNDILFARSGATVGKTYIHDKEFDACYAGYLIRYKPNDNKIAPKFVYYFTQSGLYNNWVISNTIQATIQNVSAEKYANLSIPVPTLKEQKEIINYISEQEKSIRRLQDLIKIQIQKLNEYRQSLIHEAVTGKIDVRDYV